MNQKIELHHSPPREQSGRDSFGRYKAQVRSAAIAALSILEGKKVDRVYCDLHDDFVIRKKDSKGFSYLFHQVKTKGKQNHNWTLGEVFGLNSKLKDQSKQDNKKIKESFVGKLLLHTIVFDESCNGVVFQTNIHTSDDVNKLLNDIELGVYSNKYSEVILQKFNSIFGEEIESKLSEEQIKQNLSKLSFETDVQCLKTSNNYFEPEVREKIFTYSEVDLDLIELKEIMLKLLDLVETKSSGVIPELTHESIEKLAGIAIDDLLSVLSISKDAYQILKDGGDSTAVKSASIIQRCLIGAGAGNKEVKYASKCKTDWDIWLRLNRHVIREYDLNTITQQVGSLFLDSIGHNHLIKLVELKVPIENLIKKLIEQNLIYDLTEDLIFGGVLSELVRGKS